MSDGVVVAPVMGVIKVMARQRRVFILPRALWAAGWLSTPAIAVAVAARLQTW